MLDLVYSINVEPEEVVGEDARSGRIGHDNVDDGGNEEGEGDGPAPGAESIVGVLRPDDTVVVLVKVLDMLLGDLEAQMLASARVPDGPPG